jgi:hypothetical protein
VNHSSCPRSTGRLALALLSVVVLASLGGVGCRTPDLSAAAAGASVVCEVHHVKMMPEYLPIWSGEKVYRTGYVQAARTRFPHHGIGLYQGERPSLSMWARQVRVDVCPQCTQAYQQYWNQSHP